MFAWGIAAWTFVEYAIHGWMSHRFATFARPLHDTHHRDPSAVFALGAWLPTVIIWFVALTRWGMMPGTFFLSGIVAGFAAYEAIHYRLHFAVPSNRVEKLLRTRHLIHHFQATRACFGVTVPLWDVIFGTEPTSDAMRTMTPAVASLPPLDGRSNLGRFATRFGLRSRRPSTAA